LPLTILNQNQVLFENNNPSRWLFTSTKDGAIKKKTRDKTNHLTIKRRFSQYNLSPYKRDMDEACLAIVLYNDGTEEMIRDDEEWGRKLLSARSSGGGGGGGKKEEQENLIVVAIRPGMVSRRTSRLETLYRVNVNKVSHPCRSAFK